jgi:DNA-binding transcriptional LysR family regulator
MDAIDELAGVDVPLLAALQQLIATESVTAAARRLGTTQPNMSRLLARLRELFADPLLVPVGRRMEPTVRARALAPRLEAALATMRQLFAPAPAPSPHEERRIVSIAASDYATTVVLAPWLKRLRAEAPGIVVRVQPLGPESIDPLARGDLDLAITPRVVLDGIEQFVFRKLLADRLVCVRRKGHPRARHKLTLKEYLACEHVTVSNARPSVSSVQQALHRLGKTRAVVLTVPTFLAALAAVETSDLVAALPEKLVRARAADVTVHALPFAVEGLTLHLAWHPRRTTDAQHRWLREGLTG